MCFGIMWCDRYFIMIPSNVTEIGEEAFLGCFNLTSVTSLNIVPPTIFKSSFDYIDEDLNIYVPAESVEKAQLPKRPISHVQSFLQPRQRLLCLPDGIENGIYPTGKGLYGRWLPTDSQHL